VKQKNSREIQKEKKKPGYNLWQNSWYMVRTAWHEEKSVLFLCIAVAVVTAANTIAQMLIAPAILSKVETTAPLNQLLMVILGFSLVLILLTGLQSYLNENTMFGRIQVRMSLVKAIGDKLANTSYPNLLDTNFIHAEQPAVQSTGSNQEATEAIWDTWSVILSSIIGFVVYLALLSGLHSGLLALVIFTTVAGYFVNKKINSWEYEHKEEKSVYTKKMNYIHQVTTSRTYAKDIRIFGLDHWLMDVWEKALRLYEAFLLKREKTYLWTDIVDLILAFLRNGIAYAYLIRLTLTRHLPASQFLLYFSAITGFTQWVTSILEKFTTLHKQSLDISGLREFLEWPEPFCFEEGASLTADVSRDYEIRLDQVSYRYPQAERDTISHMNLTIHPGEKLAIVGLNGAGKSTLVKLICGFLDPTEGCVRLNGEDIRQYNRKDYYTLFSSVFQDFSLLDATIGENVAGQLKNIDAPTVYRCLEKAGLLEKIQSLPDGIHSHLGRQVYEDGIELSGGQTQRLLLARALYKNAPILVLDEPTAALDPIAENDIYMKYSDMTQGRTSLFISHRLASTRFCDRILFLEHGQITEEGTHEALCALGGGYAHLFAIQSQYYQEGEEHHGEE
jgi:ATP-binding cassette subfamily B protein